MIKNFASFNQNILKHLINDSPSEITSTSGQRLKINCSVEYISFSAHTDYKQTSQFIRALKPAHIVLVHGEQTEMQKLKDALIRQYEDSTDYNIQVYNPKNTQPVELYFRGEKSAKVIGKLASATLPKVDAEISGVLVKRNFKYAVIAAEDLPNYTDLAISNVLQRQSVPFKGNDISFIKKLNFLSFILLFIGDHDLLMFAVQKNFGNYKQQDSSSIKIRVLDAIEMSFEKNFIILEVIEFLFFF